MCRPLGGGDTGAVPHRGQNKSSAPFPLPGDDLILEWTWEPSGAKQPAVIVQRVNGMTLARHLRVQHEDFKFVIRYS